MKNSGSYIECCGAPHTAFRIFYLNRDYESYKNVAEWDVFPLKPYVRLLVESCPLKLVSWTEFSEFSSVLFNTKKTKEL